MRIECSISFWEKGCLVFEPEKVAIIIKDFFPEVVFEETNYSRFYLENFLSKIREEKLEPPDFIVDKKWELAFQSGPTYKFEIVISNQDKISGLVKRYSVEFETGSEFKEEVESKIIECLNSPNYGEIHSDRQTKNFCEPLESFQDFWKLK